MSSSRTDVDAIVVGAGFGGLNMLHELRKLDLTVTVFEAGGGVGVNRAGAKCADDGGERVNGLSRGYTDANKLRFREPGRIDEAVAPRLRVGLVGKELDRRRRSRAALRGNIHAGDRHVHHRHDHLEHRPDHHSGCPARLHWCGHRRRDRR